MKRRITKAIVQFLSLVPAGANQLPVMYKAEDQTFELALLSKAGENFEEQGEITAAVYVPERLDSQNELASAEVIKDALYGFAKEGHQIDIRHDGKVIPRDKAFVAENFLIQKGDARFANMKDKHGTPVDVTGGWGVVVKVLDDDLKQKYRTKQWAGVSMGGVAARVIEKEDDAGDNIADRVVQILEKKQEIPMTTEELDKKLEKNNETLLGKVKELLTAAPVAKTGDPAPAPAPAPQTPPAAKKPVAPVLKENPTLDDIKKHELALRRFEITSAIDPANLESVRKGATDLAALEKEITDAAKGGNEGDEAEQDRLAGITKEDTDETRDLKRKLAKAQKRSNANGGGNLNKQQQQAATEDTIEVNSSLSKEDQDAARAGAELARARNKSMGFIGA